MADRKPAPRGLPSFRWPVAHDDVLAHLSAEHGYTPAGLTTSEVRVAHAAMHRTRTWAHKHHR